jgi:hypothetical protein
LAITSGIRKTYAQLKSWSYSTYTQYLGCPYSVCLEKIQKVRVVEPENPHFVKGNRVHGSAEQYISAPGRAPGALEPELTKLKPLLTRLRKAKARVEQEWAFDKLYNPVAWFSPQAWLRVKTDVCADTLAPPAVEIVDWKTGRPHDEHRQQRSLYALGGLQLVQLGALAGGSKDTTLTAQHVYVDWPDSTATESYAMKHLPALKREWAARIKPMMEDTRFLVKPGSACRWCKFNAKNGLGGPCQDGR